MFYMLNPEYPHFTEPLCRGTTVLLSKMGGPKVPPEYEGGSGELRVRDQSLGVGGAEGPQPKDQGARAQTPKQLGFRV